MDTSIRQQSRPRYGMIAILMIGAFLAVLNNTLMNIALPSIMGEFKVDTATAQWLTSGFMLVNGVIIPTTAFFIQKYSVRRLFIAAIGIFIVGTFLSGIAPTFSILLVGRMIQAVGSAIIMPLSMNVMLISFPIEKRGSAMGVFGMVIMGAPAIGPTVSGWIIEHYHWRMLFYIETPAVFIVLLIGIFLLKDKKGHVAIQLDVFSFILSSLGFGGLLYGFSISGSKGWDHPTVSLTILVGILALLGFSLRQMKLKNPMVDIRIFKYPMYALSSLIVMITTMVMFSGMILIPVYVQTVRGISPLDAGLMVMPGAILMALTSPITGKLFDRFGGKVLAIIGLSIVAITSYYFSILTTSTGYYYLTILFAIRMFGMSLVIMPVTTNGINQLPSKLYPHGTAMNNTLQQVSGAIGTAILVSIMMIRADHYEKAHASGPLSQEQLTTNALLEGINLAFYVSGFLAIAGIVMAFFIKRAHAQEEKVPYLKPAFEKKVDAP